MTRIARTLVATTGSLVAALALTAAATAGSSPTPNLSAGAGCSIACIESALVTATASSASVEVKTSVPTSVTASVSKLDTPLGLTTAPRPKHVSIPSFLKTRTFLFPGLEPATAYRIVVSARDLGGKVQTRSGTFSTRKVQVAVDLPDVGLSAGLGCKADCIEKGTLTSDATVPGRVRLALRATEPVTFQVRFVAKSTSGAVLQQLIHSTGSRKREHEATLDGLLTGTRYTVTVKATDAQGRGREETGTFRTRSAKAVVTFHKITVISDAENGADRGEIFFDFMAGGEYGTAMGFQKIGSGDTVAVKPNGTSRPGLLIGAPIDGRRTIDLDVLGVECDAVLMKNCVVEGGRWSTEQYAGDTYVATRTSFDLRQAFTPSGALPGNYGTGLPSGHDAYVVWETTQHSLKYRVYATVDVEVA
jgi:hypothetical protein